MAFMGVKWADMDRTLALKGCNEAAKNAEDAIEDKKDDIDALKAKFAKGGMQKDRYEKKLAQLNADIVAIEADAVALNAAADILRG